MLLPPLLLALVVRPLSLNTLNYLPSGPTAVIFSLLCQFYAAIPHVYKYRLSTGIPSAAASTSSSSSASASTAGSGPTILLSDKSTTYLLASQLALSQFPYSLLPAAVGWAVGYAWRIDALPGSAAAWRLPTWLWADEEAAAYARAMGADFGSGRRITGARAGGRTRTSANGLGFGGDAATAAVGAGGVETEQFEGLRRRLEGESRAAAALAGRQQRSSGGGDLAGSGQGVGRALAGQILDRFRGSF